MRNLIIVIVLLITFGCTKAEVVYPAKEKTTSEVIVDTTSEDDKRIRRFWDTKGVVTNFPLKYFLRSKFGGRSWTPDITSNQWQIQRIKGSRNTNPYAVIIIDVNVVPESGEVTINSPSENGVSFNEAFYYDYDTRCHYIFVNTDTFSEGGIYSIISSNYAVYDYLELRSGQVVSYR